MVATREWTSKWKIFICLDKAANFPFLCGFSVHIPLMLAFTSSGTPESTQTVFGSCPWEVRRQAGTGETKSWSTRTMEACDQERAS